MNAEEGLEVGDVVQIDPAHDDRFGRCFMIISDLKSFGAQGYVSVPGEEGLAYYRCPWAAMHKVGKAKWVSE